MRFRAIFLATSLPVALTIGLALSPGAAGRGVTCSSFASQAAAQSYFLDHGGPQHDPAGLDPDHDGLACETNPLPYRGLLTINFNSAYNTFTGRVRSVSASCVNPRTVKILRVRDGRDRFIDSTETTATGGYRLPAPSVRGQFYARTVAKGYCTPDQSPFLRYPPPSAGPVGAAG